MQSTQLPEPLQKSPEPHAVLMARFGLVGVPAVQMSPVQALPSTGRSVLNVFCTGLPEPLHSHSLQSPVVWFPGGRSVPMAALVNPHVLLLQV